MRNTETRDAGQYNDTKTQHVRETRTGTHQVRRYNTPLNCITLSSCTTKHLPHGTYQGACGRSETDGGGGERRRRRRGVGRRQEGGRGRRSLPDSTTCGKASETPPSRSRSLSWGERTVFRPSQKETGRGPSADDGCPTYPAPPTFRSLQRRRTGRFQPDDTVGCAERVALHEAAVLAPHLRNGERWLVRSPAGGRGICDKRPGRGRRPLDTWRRVAPTRRSTPPPRPRAVGS